MSLRVSKYVATTVVAVFVVCGPLTACGSMSNTTKSKEMVVSAAATRGKTRRSKTGEACVREFDVEFAGGQIKTPMGMTGSRLKAILKKCGFVQTKVVGEPMLEAGAKASPHVLYMVTKFAACMRQSGVDIPPPNPKDSAPLIDTVGIELHSTRVKLALQKCSRYLDMGVK
jgi:hypothetical protein